jgi:DNA-binding response OmpR family regulator
MTLTTEPATDLAATLQLSVTVIEDHEALRAVICDTLSQNGWDVVGVACAEDLDQMPHRSSVDVFVVDVNLPGEDGMSLSRRLRAAYPLVGLVMLTARSEVEDRIAGYNSGADLYLTKPVSEQELLASVAAVARKKRAHDQLIQAIHHDPLVLDATGLRLIGRAGVAIRLSSAETQILGALAKAPGQRLEVWQIVSSLGHKVDSYPRSTLAVRMTRLRKKLIDAGAPPNCLESVRNEGYQLCVTLSLL